MGHSQFHLELDEHASSDDIQTVLRGLEQFNLGFAPPIGYRPLNIFLRNDANQTKVHSKKSSSTSSSPPAGTCSER